MTKKTRALHRLEFDYFEFEDEHGSMDWTGIQMAKRVKLGDIVQILTSEGVSYAQLSHINPEFGYLIRIFEGTYPKRPKDWAEVVARPVQFSAFFPLQSAVNQALLAVVGNCPVPEAIASFPTFRSRNGGRGGSIWLWDGKAAVMLDRPLGEEEQSYPVEGIISAPLLIERIENGYRPEVNDRW
ncbi:MAG: hypothetical protein ACTHOL_19340 [Luteibacter jiangsuensis]